MKMRLQYAVLVLFVLLANSCGKEPLESSAELETENAVPLEQELLGMVNDYRNTLGYSTLEFSPIAYDYANQHTDYMIATGSINHDGFTSRASNISTEVNASAVAENVAKDYPTAKVTFEKWVASSGHRKNIEGDFTHTAVSVKKDASGHYYYTQLFYR
ncbi:CAP domain-containing protein [Flavobacteriaceae bacterium F89]|uniref:CAP domain-containing protein n=1 Tax=Cerina litoralis TaxID=2874477 RepID=A0AAE3JN19_9FLAO|nr:CAP domain-containing protein [Cerina litoralis]MCG2459404.1 CAP domain-containing protein [Cerina litoralis]